MSDLAIDVRGLSKLYRLGAAPTTQSFRELITGTASSLARRVTGRSRPAAPATDLWALRDVTFSVRQGEVIGIIGSNGAGKSTLLKILSQITDPTRGEATIRGRVASLLEVGTGFHPELTGRENIFLNGTILGMTRREIAGKLDRIIDFSGVEKFLDTPVKNYSSGMTVRLAFAVAAHLEPEILIVDEVLAVGDAAFQKKCLGKMQEVSGAGRTVLFVSHNMSALQSLCTRGILLRQGQVVADGPTAPIIKQYLAHNDDAGQRSLDDRDDRGGDGSVRLTAIDIADADGGPIGVRSRLRVTLSYRSHKPVRRSQFLVGVYDTLNTGIYLLDTDANGGLPETLPAEGSLTCVTEPIGVTPGRCFVNVAIRQNGAMADYVTHARHFDIEAGDTAGLASVPSRDWVLCVLPHRWDVETGAAHGHRHAA